MATSEAAEVPDGPGSETDRTSPAILIRNLSRTFGNKTAVDDLSLEVAHGTFFGFLGPNGAGKSTTVRMLTGLLEPSRGDAWIEGHSIRTEAVAAKRTMGVVPDQLALFDRLGLREHLVFAAQIHGLPLAEAEKRAEDLLRLLDLWEDRDTYAVDASHGMRKKTALAMALIHRPKVLFLDEPFEGIDAVASRHIRDLLVQLTRSGVTIFLTSHILDIVERLSDRVAILVGGRIVEDTTRQALRDSGQSLEQTFLRVVGAPAERPELDWLA